MRCLKLEIEKKKRKRKRGVSHCVCAVAVCQESVCMSVRVYVLSDSSQTALLLFHLIGHERVKERKKETTLSVPAELRGSKRGSKAEPPNSVVNKTPS